MQQTSFPYLGGKNRNTVALWAIQSALEDTHPTVHIDYDTQPTRTKLVSQRVEQLECLPPDVRLKVGIDLLTPNKLTNPKLEATQNPITLALELEIPEELFRKIAQILYVQKNLDFNQFVCQAIEVYLVQPNQASATVEDKPYYVAAL
jgi:hypothetical protein